jgi:hypothetical protein
MIETTKGAPSMPTQPIILSAVDLDGHATDVIAQGARLAALCQGHLVVVHVVDYPGGYESDNPFPQRPGDVLDAMVRHARASLVGMVNHLDLPTEWVQIRVETGSVTQTLADIAGALQPRYCLVGPARLGPLSPSAGLAAAIKGRSDCELLAVPAKPGGDEDKGLLPRLRHWLARDLGTPAGHAR